MPNTLDGNSNIEFIRSENMRDDNFTSSIFEVYVDDDKGRAYLGELSRYKHEWKVYLTGRDLTAEKPTQAKDIEIDWKDFVGIFQKFLLFIEQSDAHYISKLRQFAPEDEEEIYGTKDDTTE